MKHKIRFYELIARIPEETLERMKKQMTCAYFNGGDCSKGLPGTPCILEGCIAWQLHPDFEKEIKL